MTSTDLADARLAATRTWTPSTPPRGTVVLLAGRGESAGLYERFGTRIAADGYTVTAVATDASTSDAHSPDAQNTDAAAATLDALAGSGSAVDRPLVLAGSDVGALLALTLAAGRRDLVDGLLLAGTPAGGTTTGGADDEFDLRSACPVHRRRMADGLTPGALSTTPVDDGLRLSAVASRPAVPALVIHGEDDAVAPLDDALRLAGALPAAQSVVVRGGRHDILNDVTHRSVAAAIVQFLERLRESPTAEPLLLAGPGSRR